ncbi:cobalamin-binding protein [Salinisphaera hydrothermalis]|uniref:Fe3+-hydroxamate ABC transporter periplasmic binding protein n=1 Tax=Salinisphaera hydrothermalis (strain C41B8) TaxID=1304275 RepID=A0A084IIC4_SALHC|nr:cobalamin-binding protein [Salinisphaera hydrothermalis]KEZ76458.1 Fe3+-hydroxamate ABC transporter periplasmic binding protein [Salinisphaera hydrothermalis C41B8]
MMRRWAGGGPRALRNAGRLGLLVMLCVWAGSPALAAPVSVTDFTGHRVRLDHPARRIVALTPHLVENLFSAGLGDRVVGAVRYSNYPPAAKNIPRVGGYNSLSLEAIVARKPDLVVAWAEGGSPDIIKRLRALGIAVYVDDPRRLAGIARTIRDLGVLGHTEGTADRAATAFEHRIAGLRKRYAHRRPVSLFWEVWSDPLRTLSDAGMTGAVIKLCGGRNVFGHAPILAPQVSIESVIARDPQAIVASGVAETKPHWKAYWQQWPTIPAVAHHHFVAVDPDLISRPTVRLADGAAELCRGLDRVRKDLKAR